MNIKLAESPEEREQVYRLRYKVYVEEMGLNPAEADHSHGIITDPLDATGKILAAFSEGEVVGTVRLNLARDTDMGEWREVFQMEQFGPFSPDCVSMTSRFIVAPQYRSGTLFVRLARTGFRLYYDLGMRFDTVCCHGRQVSLFTRMGYRQLLPNFHLDGYGESHALVLAIADTEHLASVGSPFLSGLPPVVDDRGSVDYFYENLCEPELALEAC